MDLSSYLFALFLLLVVPGPTNMVLAMTGADRGLSRSLPMAAVVVLGYISTVLPVHLIAAPHLEAHPMIADGVKLLAAAWVLVLALRLWSPAPDGQHGADISAVSVYVTTVLNPKGLVMALALLPAARANIGLPAALAVLTATIVFVSALWTMLGASAVASLSSRHPVVVARSASACLMVFSATLAAKAVGLL